MALLLESEARAKLDQVIDVDRLAWHDEQIALRRAHNVPRAEPPEPHIDDIPSPHNGVPAEVLVLNFHGAGWRLPQRDAPGIRRQFHRVAGIASCSRTAFRCRAHRDRAASWLLANRHRDWVHGGCGRAGGRHSHAGRWNFCWALEFSVGIVGGG
jgi:hypothetical protein